MQPGSIESVARRHGIALIVQFGSTVSGTTHPHSDVDLGLLFERAHDPQRDLAAIDIDLQRFFPDREIDLGVLNHADPLFLKQATTGARLLAGSPARLQQLQLYAFKRFEDYRPYLAFEHDYVRRHAGVKR